MIKNRRTDITLVRCPCGDYHRIPMQIEMDDSYLADVAFVDEIDQILAVANNRVELIERKCPFGKDHWIRHFVGLCAGETVLWAGEAEIIYASERSRMERDSDTDPIQNDGVGVED